MIIKLAKELDSHHYKVHKKHTVSMDKARSETSGPYGKSALIGGILGALVGAGATNEDSAGAGMLIGGAGGALLGLGVANIMHESRAHGKASQNKEFRKLDKEKEYIEEFRSQQAMNDEMDREMMRSPFRRYGW